MAAGLDATPPRDRPCDVARTDASNVQWSERWCSADPESSDRRLHPPIAESSAISSHRPQAASATASSAGVLVALVQSGLTARHQTACHKDAARILMVTQRRATRWSGWLRRCGPFTNQVPGPSGLIAGDLHFEWHVGEDRISHHDRSNSVRFQKTSYCQGFEFRRAASFGMENRFQAHSSGSTR